MMMDYVGVVVSVDLCWWNYVDDGVGGFMLVDLSWWFCVGGFGDGGLKLVGLWWIYVGCGLMFSVVILFYCKKIYH